MLCNGIWICKSIKCYGSWICIGSKKLHVCMFYNEKYEFVKETRYSVWFTNEYIYISIQVQ